MTSDKLILFVGDEVLTSDKLSGSGFNTLIITYLHVGSDGSFYLNENELMDASGNLQSSGTTLQQVIVDLTTSGGFGTVLLSFGGGDMVAAGGSINAAHSQSDSDFMAISTFFYPALAATPSDVPLFTNLKSLINTLGADGIDICFQPVYFGFTGVLSGAALLHLWGVGEKLTVTWTVATGRDPIMFWQSFALMLPSPTWANIPANVYAAQAGILTQWAIWLSLDISAIVPSIDDADAHDTQVQLAECVTGGANVTSASYWSLETMLASGYAPFTIVGAMLGGLLGNFPP